MPHQHSAALDLEDKKIPLAAAHGQPAIMATHGKSKTAKKPAKKVAASAKAKIKKRGAKKK